MSATIRAVEERLQSLPTAAVDFGDETAWRFFLELADEQSGYAVSGDGESLVSSEPGGWRESWVVIGRNGLGDPFFVDVEAADLPVFDAAHGEGAWTPNLVAESLESFFSLLRIVDELQGCWRERKTALDRLLAELVRPEQLEGEAWKSWKGRVREAKQIKADVSAARNKLLAEVSGKAAKWWRAFFSDLNSSLRETLEGLPNSKADGCFVIGQNHAKRHKPAIRSDPRFANIILCGHYQPWFCITGTVASRAALEDLERLVEATEPPFPLMVTARVEPEP